MFSSDELIRVCALGVKYGNLEIEDEGFKHRNVKLVRCDTADDLLKACPDVHVILLGSGVQVTGSLIQNLKSLRGIIRYGIGFNNIDLNAAREHGVIVSYVPDYCIDEVSTHTAMLVLILSRQLPSSIEGIQKGKWGVQAVTKLHCLREQTIGVMGCGRIGQSVIQKLKPFGARILAYDPVVPPQVIKETGATPVDFDAILRESDYITLHLPLTSATQYLINEGSLKEMKRNAHIVNTARGGLIDESALLDALNEGRIAGAALDVLEDEQQFSDNKLISHPAVVVTPHIAWYTEESENVLRKSVVAEANLILDGQPPVHQLV